MRVLSFLVLFFSVISVKAQELPSLNETDNLFIGGAVMGGNISNITNDYYEGYHKAGINAGLTVYARIKGKLWSSIELLYSRKGTVGVRESETYYAGPYFEKYILKLNYAELPVMIHYFQHKWYHFSLGGSYSRLINSKEEMASIQPVNINNELYRFNPECFDFIIGGGLHVNKNLFLNIRYQRSVTPARNALYVPQVAGAGNQFNNTFAFQLVYLVRYNRQNP